MAEGKIKQKIKGYQPLKNKTAKYLKLEKQTVSGRNAGGPRFAFVPKGRGSQCKKCNEHNLRNQLKMAKLQMLIKKETFQHLK